eukprot:TRINITY_DN2894_c0_g2_i1.p1 TRINITY_DN2894_c0_g2~~TRINITY_DN2894_c0_g2_i1.p1  ORF type:complete len:204 (+),score=34.33 TRINITY_DN2894_c0_g2_i1:75-686(+)
MASLLLASIEKFNQGGLKKTETRRVEADGKVCIETRDGETVEAAGSGVFMVEDTRDDTTPNQVVPGLFIGSLCAATCEPKLTEAGITHVVDATAMNVEPFPERFRYLHLEIYDLNNFPIQEHFETAADFIHEARQNGGSVLVHCQAGVSRSASLVLAYLMKYENMSFDDAHHLLKEKRPCIYPNAGFKLHLKTFESTLRARAQ